MPAGSLRFPIHCVHFPAAGSTTTCGYGYPLHHFIQVTQIIIPLAPFLHQIQIVGIMGKHDLKFFATTLGGIGVFLGIGGHCVRLWMHQNPDFVTDPTNLSTLAQMAIYSGMAIWMWALALLAESKGYAKAWGLCGGLMAMPFAGLVPWFLLLAATDKRVELSDRLMQPRKDPFTYLDSGTIHIRFASDMLDRDTKALSSSEQPYDPWSVGEQRTKGGATGTTATLAPTVNYAPSKPRRNYRW